MNSSLLHGRSPSLPLTLGLHTGDKLVITQWLRVLPGQRYVGRGTWQGRSVLAKLFVGTKAQRHFQRELTGVQSLAQQQLNTPQLLASDFDAAFGGWILFDYLADAQNLEQQWQQHAAEPMLSTAQEKVLGQALTSIARMHAQGLWQKDIHLDNFLVQSEQLYIIDGGAIAQQTLGQPINQEAALKNLAVFFAQLPRALETHVHDLLTHYMQTNATHALPLQELHSKIQQVRDWRVNDYLKKTARDCSLFSVRKNSHGIIAVQRSYVAETEPLLANPDEFIEQGHIYKTGGAATVARVEQGNKNWIIKRYNIKSFSHWLKRCWRPTRAWHSWQAAHRLQQLEIPVANTIAVKEQRTLGLRRTAWLITEYCGEQDLIARFQPYIDNAQVPEADLTALQLLLNSMIREKISHGDLKGHNILWHNGRCLLIDLDAVRAHSSPRSFVRAFSRDRARLLRNWPQESPLYKLLDQHLPQLLDN